MVCCEWLSPKSCSLNLARHIFGVISGAPGHSGPRATYFAEWTRFISEFFRGSYLFNMGVGFGAGNYNTTVWSIAAEVRGSMIIYSVLIAFLALEWSPTRRFWASFGLFIYFLYVVDADYFALFMMGLLLCDMDLLAENDPFHLPKIVSRFKIMSKQRWMYYLPLLVGLYLASAPHVETIQQLREEPGYASMAIFIPSTAKNARWFLASWGAVLVAIAIPRILWLRKFFESPFCQYLGEFWNILPALTHVMDTRELTTEICTGKISFGFYLVHGPCIWTIGDRLLAATGRPHRGAEDRVPRWMNAFPMSDWGPLGLEINAIAPQLILLPCTLYFAGVVTKLFDEPSVTFAKWLFKQPGKK